jgi:tetratricopeptide (TPR) repeat protein
MALSSVPLDKLQSEEKLGDAYGDFEPVYHKYVHFLTRHMMPPMPLWLAEGLAEFYGNTQVENNRIWLGVPSDSNIDVLRQALLMPRSPPLSLDTLFCLDASSPYYHEDNRATIFYAECWALTNYLITRDWREHTHRFTDFVALLGQNVAQDEAARRTLGDLSALQEALGEYIGHSDFTVVRQDAPATVHENQFETQDISAAESLAVRADFMAHDHHYAEARGMLEEALKLDPASASAHEGMGFLCTQQGKLDEANKWYRQAVGLNSQSYLAHYLYAVNLLNGKLKGDSVSPAESNLRAAIKINPGFAPAYDRLGWLLASRQENAEKPERLNEAHKMATAAVSLEPGNIYYRLDYAEVLDRMGRVADAVEVAERAATTAQTPDEHTAALAVLANAQEYRNDQKQAKVRQEAAEKARALAPREAANGSNVDADSFPPNTVVLVKHSPRPELLPSRSVVEGTIKGSKCSGLSTLELALSSSTGEIQLFSDSYTKIPYSALNYTPIGILNPCVELEGRHARITYHPAKSQPHQGEIVAVEVVRD